MPVLSHDAAQIAEEREKIASQITEDQIFIETVKRAIKVEGAEIQDKLIFAFTSLPDSMTNFESAKEMFFGILEFLSERDEVSQEEIEEFKKYLEGIKAVDQLMSLQVQ